MFLLLSSKLITLFTLFVVTNGLTKSTVHKSTLSDEGDFFDSVYKMLSSKSDFRPNLGPILEPLKYVSASSFIHVSNFKYTNIFWASFPIILFYPQLILAKQKKNIPISWKLFGNKTENVRTCSKYFVTSGNEANVICLQIDHLKFHTFTKPWNIGLTIAAYPSHYSLGQENEDANFLQPNFCCISASVLFPLEQYKPNIEQLLQNH